MNEKTANTNLYIISAGNIAVKKIKIISVVGARPNFMKIAPFVRAIESYNQQNGNTIEHLLVHTGQHYDTKMSQSFFEQLNIPEPDINLEVGSGSHAEQVGKTMMAFEKVVQEQKPDWVVVVGDVNATLACSVTAKKEWVRCCHIEAGLRSGDMQMPEEINRLVTDRLSDLLLTPDRLSNENLYQEGVTDERIRFVGNIMIDTLDANLPKARELDINRIVSTHLVDGQDKTPDISEENYAVVTLHRPSNVDDPVTLKDFSEFICHEVTDDLPVIWPVHPRTLKQLQKFGLFDMVIAAKNVFITHPLGYHEMLRLNMTARMFLTDSGGLQEECTVLGTPCLTMRKNTERPVTLTKYNGMSVLVGNDMDLIHKEYAIALKRKRETKRPELWDGQTAMRCVQAIVEKSL